MSKNRLSGVLFPVSALPSAYNIGDFGKKAYEFADIIEKGGFKIWQVLPINPLGYGHSPYQPFSSFAIEEGYCDLEDLRNRGLLSELPAPYLENEPKVHYEEARSYKEPYLHKAYEVAKTKERKEIDAFASSHPWAHGYGIFMMNKKRNNLVSWNFWPKEQQDLIDNDKLNEEEKAKVDYEVWLQMTLYRQWLSLKKYCNDKGIKMIGDIPFYVGYDSLDVYSQKGYFLLDNEYKPTYIAGVPPDYFSPTGQRWGNPIYDWEKLEKEHFSLVIERLTRNAELYDVIRIDHFRAFDTYWKIPSSCETAIEGKWVEAPGYAFFNELKKVAPSIEIIAEDLGDLRPQVLELRDHFSLPGMNVVEFSFLSASTSGYMADKENMVAYIATHDNETLMGYYFNLSEEEKKKWNEELEKKNYSSLSLCDKVIEYTLSLKAKYAIFAVQDLLALGNEARINKPGIIDDVNWTYRLKSFSPLSDKMPKLKELITKYGRE